MSVCSRHGLDKAFKWVYSGMDCLNHSVIRPTLRPTLCYSAVHSTSTSCLCYSGIFHSYWKKISQESNAKKVKAKHNNSKKEFTLELHRVLHLVMIIFTFVSGFRLFLCGLFFSPSSDTKLSCGLVTLRWTCQWTESKTPLIREWAIPQSVLTELKLEGITACWICASLTVV